VKVNIKDAAKDMKEMRPNVKANILLAGKRIMLWLVRIDPNGVVLKHSHPHEQVSVCLKGKAESMVDGSRRILRAGDISLYPSKREHGPFKALGGRPALFLDIFSPPRRDFMKMLSAQKFYKGKGRFSKKRERTSPT